MVDRLMSSYGASEGHACRVLCVTRGTYRYRSRLDPRTEIQMRIREIAQRRVRYGYRKIRVLLNREGWNVVKYLVYRLPPKHPGSVQINRATSDVCSFLLLFQAT
jgi:putative transposase